MWQIKILWFWLCPGLSVFVIVKVSLISDLLQQFEPVSSFIVVIKLLSLHLNYSGHV